MKDRCTPDEKALRDERLTVETEAALGKKIQSFRPDSTNIFAGFMLGMILIIGGFTAGLGMVCVKDFKHPGKQELRSRYISASIFITFGSVGGLFMLRWMKRLRTHRVDVHENGFLYCDGHLTDVCLWKEVAELNERFAEIPLQVLKVPGAVIRRTEHFIRVHRRDQKEFTFHTNSIKKLSELAELLRKARLKYGFGYSISEE